MTDGGKCFEKVSLLWSKVGFELIFSFSVIGVHCSNVVMKHL